MAYRGDRRERDPNDIAHMEIDRTEDRVIVPESTGTVNAAVNYHDRVRWGPIFAGIFIAIATQLVLSALATAVGLTTNLGATGVGIWTVINLFISLLVGSWVMARSCGPMNNRTAMLNGAILWATTLGLSTALLALGVSGAFGILAANQDQIQGQAGTTNQQELARQAAQAAWSFVIGSLLGLAAALIGASIGARKSRRHTTTTTTTP